MSNSTSEIASIVEEVAHLAFTQEERIALYVFFIKNSIYKAEVKSVLLTCTTDAKKLDYLKSFLSSKMFLKIQQQVNTCLLLASGILNFT